MNIMSQKSQFIAPCRFNSCINAARQTGLSLIELMIAITLGLLIMTALITLFVDMSRTNSEMAKTNAQIENGRFAMQLLQNDIVHGGFWGGYVPKFDDLTETNIPTDAPTAVPAPCLPYSTPWDNAYKINLVGIPIQAYDGIPTGCSAIVTNKKANTDVLLVRHAATCLSGIGNCEVDVAGKLYFQYSRCENEISAGEPYIYVLDDDGVPVNFTLKKRGCTGTPPTTTGVAADKRKFISNIYYIRDYAMTVGDGIPTLMRSEFDLDSGTLAHKTAEPLINGIEGFRVELGIDNVSDDNTDIITGKNPPNTGAVDPTLLYTAAIKWADDDNLVSPRNRGDGSPDKFIRCPAAGCSETDLTNVVAVQLYVLARAEKVTPGYTDTKVYNLGTTTLGPFNDGFKRHVFSTTVRLNNVSSRRETP